ncbi:hypothetical protein [Methanosarcina sp.]|uniref:hypothetical protein n=1 Tax=Methanosarcina sp. TaxID=2213 RepID=UPI002AB99F76|nr:hypothetical protein [Methanosarcina sp.]MDY9927884.1 hypothetical protein [Methanosarcina sp.]
MVFSDFINNSRTIQVFIDEEKTKQKILNLSPKEARELGIKYRSTLKKIRDRIIKEEKININYHHSTARGTEKKWMERRASGRICQKRGSAKKPI